jgi:hypothetical protein
MKTDVERREGNEEARAKGDDLGHKSKWLCGIRPCARAWVCEGQWLQDAEEGSKGLRKAGLEEPRAAKKGASGPLHERYENEWKARGYPLLVPDGVFRRLQCVCCNAWRYAFSVSPKRGRGSRNSW